MSVGDDDDFGIQLEVLDQKRSVDAQQRGIILDVTDTA